MTVRRPGNEVLRAVRQLSLGMRGPSGAALARTTRMRLYAGEPCPVCNRPDADTLPELPEGFVVANKREDRD
jgi:hypothetical protein